METPSSQSGSENQIITRLLKDMLAIPSPTGLCAQASDYVERALTEIGLDTQRMRDGALRAVIAGADRAAPALGFIVHLDTLGAQIKRIKDDGRLQLVPVGTWSARFAEGARVTVHGDERRISGTILPLKASGHTYNTEVDSLPVGWEHVELRIDAPVRSRSDAIEAGINTGDLVSIDPQPEFLDNGYIVARHLDNKAGVACLLAATGAIMAAGKKPSRDIHLMFTVSEEVGTGASAIVDPAIADLIAIDIGTTAPGQDSDEHCVTIGMGDQTGPFDHGLTRHLIETCRKNGIVHQRDVFRYYKSDLASARQAGVDARMALIAFGVDASHGYERIHCQALDGVERLIQLLATTDTP